ncbi:MAG: hypothetical protein WCK47_05535 [bacterium]
MSTDIRSASTPSGGQRVRHQAVSEYAIRLDQFARILKGLVIERREGQPIVHHRRTRTSTDETDNMLFSLQPAGSLLNLPG